eukprot:CAMPEP_0202900848 /NCGR_PEP_ID=MMETSP1392-20130828/12072_1 /ASSEMBLY_ACC=CAM_ASM_000868 /TAXON_ID=225041 /ORGANISM="Chlamydomonas chlamydogama, Strain SAG 11-48b" /LENGTH=268 /DNA_ID=CAMNT_0049587301 /DNA_START=217 /DNA_END=1023 /DNA_ORIENTATION=-
MSLARRVETSPVRYSIIRSNAPRFHDSATPVPFGVYDTDHAHKKSVESHARDNRRFYASSFQSTVPRFTRPWSSPTTDAFYDVNTTKNARAATVSKSVEDSSIKYAIHRSKYKRFSDKPLNDGPDVIYETDRGHKLTLYSSMLKSPISYGNMGAPLKKFGSVQLDSYHNHLGPGMYDYPYHKDVVVSPALEERPLSSLISQTPRFGGRKVGGVGLGSSYKPEVDAKAWLATGRTISRAEYLRPQYLPKSYMKKAQEGKQEGRSDKPQK